MLQLKTCFTEITTIVLSGQIKNLNIVVYNFKTLNYLCAKKNKLKFSVVLVKKHQTPLIFGNFFYQIYSNTYVTFLVLTTKQLVLGFNIIGVI